MAASAPVGHDQVNLQIVDPENFTGRHSDPHSAKIHRSGSTLGPPERIEPAAVHRLYRGVVGEVNGKGHRIWIDFPMLQLRWAPYDMPPRVSDGASLLDLSACHCRRSQGDDESQAVCVDIYSLVDPLHCTSSDPQAGANGSPEDRLVLTVTGDPDGMRGFAGALAQLLDSREHEGAKVLHFIQKRLYQYLWRHQGCSLGEQALYEAQAVLAFNLEPKKGVAYLRGKLGKCTDAEVGEWLAQMATHKGCLDPTMLGTYFSRRDTLEVFKAFLVCLDFHGTDIVQALRRLFDTFKPGGEGQVISRLLELFAEAYFAQWVSAQESTVPKTAYANSDSILQVAFSLLMLNTELHVAPIRAAKAKMSVEEYIGNTRRVVSSEEVPEEALRNWYEAVKQTQVSVEPLPRVSFSKLPVQPDIEGWLVAVLSPQKQRRYWAVLALQRMYLFSDKSEVEPADDIDLKDTTVCAVLDDKSCRERFAADLRSATCSLCFAVRAKRRVADLPDAEARAFEVRQKEPGTPAILSKLCAAKPRTRLALVAESEDLAEKWVHRISAGPY